MRGLLSGREEQWASSGWRWGARGPLGADPIIWKTQLSKACIAGQPGKAGESSEREGSVETMENSGLLHRGEAEGLVLGGLCAVAAPAGWCSGSVLISVRRAGFKSQISHFLRAIFSNWTMRA